MPRRKATSFVPWYSEGLSSTTRARGTRRKTTGEWPVMDTDVIIVGAGPTGLMLAVRAAPGRSATAGAGAAAADPGDPEGRRSQRADPGAAALPRPAGTIRGGQHRCPARLSDCRSAACMWTSPAWPIPRWSCCCSRSRNSSACSTSCAGELGAEIRRGHELVGLSQDDAAVTADVRGPDGPYRGDRPLPRRLRRRIAAGCATWPASRSPASPTPRSSGWRRSPCPSR